MVKGLRLGLMTKTKYNSDKKKDKYYLVLNVSYYDYRWMART
jgi:hypothetical protein